MANDTFQPGDTVTVLALGREATVERQMPEAEDYEVTLADATEEEVATRYVDAGGLALVKRASGKAAKAAAAAAAASEPEAAALPADEAPSA